VRQPRNVVPRRQQVGAVGQHRDARGLGDFQNIVETDPIVANSN
jgi:hypothetical protein